ncbi:MAG TPA: hypothetical protein VMQ44_01045 [Candidatus Saccharimonadales bacterium]|nr:hypothetical protein [Candidatus Saccharimonadales bacterium]
MNGKTISVLGRYQISADKAEVIVNKLNLPKGTTDEMRAAALDWVIDSCTRSRYNFVLELSKVLRQINLAMAVNDADLDFSLDSHGFKKLPAKNPAQREKLKVLTRCMLDQELVIKLIIDSIPDY